MLYNKWKKIYLHRLRKKRFLLKVWVCQKSRASLNFLIQIRVGVLLLFFNMLFAEYNVFYMRSRLYFSLLLIFFIRIARRMILTSTLGDRIMSSIYAIQPYKVIDDKIPRMENHGHSNITPLAMACFQPLLRRDQCRMSIVPIITDFGGIKQATLFRVIRAIWTMCICMKWFNKKFYLLFKDYHICIWSKT